MIKTILWDYGNVISAVDYESFFQNFEDLSKKKDPSRERYGTLEADYNCGRVSTDEFFRRLRAGFKPRLADGALRQAFNDMLRPIPETAKIIEGLDGRYKQNLLSNVSELHFAELKKLPLFGHLNAFTLSYVVGVMKPEPRIYEDALAKAGCAPQECLFVEDGPANIEAAQRFGINTVLYTNPQSLEKGLKEFGILT